MENIFQEMASKWPSAIVSRTEVKNFTGGIITEKYLANLDCMGKGPADRFRAGRKIFYPVASFIEWLESRSAAIPKRTPNKSPNNRRLGL